MRRRVHHSRRMSALCDTSMLVVVAVVAGCVGLALVKFAAPISNALRPWTFVKSPQLAERLTRLLGVSILAISLVDLVLGIASLVR